MKLRLADDTAQKLRYVAMLEVFLIFAVFLVFGGRPVPDVNEAYYVTKAIHYWDPGWIPNDPFLESADSHWFFCLTFGWLTHIMSPAAMAWTGRIATWLLMAWGWRRLVVSIYPKRWAPVLSAAIFVTLLHQFHFAGEWVVGNVEGKGFAYAFVFLALAEACRNRWSLAWILLGLASAFHVLVGGWSVLALGCAWTFFGPKERFRLESILWMVPGLLLGGAISLLGLLPALQLNSGVGKEIVAEAYRIQLFVRLPHHLNPLLTSQGYHFLARFVMLSAVWGLLAASWGRRHRTPNEGLRLLNGFIVGSLLIATVGLIIAVFVKDEAAQAGLMRFYWFRLSDAAVPIGASVLLTLTFFDRIAGPYRRVALLRYRQFRREGEPVLDAVVQSLLPGKRALVGAAVAIGIVLLLWIISHGAFIESEGVEKILKDPRTAFYVCLTLLILIAALLSLIRPGQWEQRTSATLYRWGPRLVGRSVLLTLVVLIPSWVMMNSTIDRCRPTAPRLGAEEKYFNEWRDACYWIAESDEIPKDARFLTPRMNASFKWYARRPNVGVWKEMPQDAESIIDWYERVRVFRAFYVEGHWIPSRNLAHSLAYRQAEGARQWGEKYEFEYAIVESWPPVRGLDVVYSNDRYTVYRLAPEEGDDTPDPEE